MKGAGFMPQTKPISGLRNDSSPPDSVSPGDPVRPGKTESLLTWRPRM